VLDVETDGLRGALTYWTAACECRPDDVTTGRTAVELWRHVTAHSGREHANRDHVWWAHNGGEYDYLYLIDPIRGAVGAGTHVASPVTRDTTTIGWRVTTGRNRTDLRDSYAVLPASLKALAASLAPDLPKLDIGLADGVTFDPSDPVHREYAARDSVALLTVLTRFRETLAERFDGALPSWSAASTALRAWTLTLRPGERYPPLQAQAVPLVRSGYYGGIVHLGSVEWHDDAVTLDVNSMYPTAMRDDGVPAGVPWRVGSWDRRRPGVYRATVHVSRETPFTFLGHRAKEGLAWPTGTFTTVATSVELAAAEERGVKVEVDGGIVWPRLVHPFSRYVDRIEAMRAEGGASSTVGKLLGNGLYGKFGSRPVRDEWMLSAERPGPDWTPPPFDATDPDEVAAHAWLWVRTDQPLRAPYLLPHWAAWITASARLRLLALAEAVGDVYYADTDSVTASAEDVQAAIAAGRVTLGPGFGDVKVERRWSRFRALGPKVVQGVDADTGEPVYKAKGIPRRQVAAAFDPGRPAVAWASANGSLRVLQGAGMTTDRTRRLSELDNSYAWGLVNGIVRPTHIGG
jgi:hypothetical protein